MSIKDYLKEQNKESRVYEYSSKNFDSFINYDKEIIKKLKNKKILFIKSKIEVECIEKELCDDEFS